MRARVASKGRTGVNRNRVRNLAALVIAAVGQAATLVHADDVIKIDSDTAVVTFNGMAVGQINGTPIADGGVQLGVRRILVLGDFSLQPFQRLEAAGSRPVRIIVAGNALISNFTTIKVSAEDSTPGNGGGPGAEAPSMIGAGGDGGKGGGAPLGGTPMPGSDGANGSNNVGGFGGEGGANSSTDGGIGGIGNPLTGVAGGSRSSRLPGRYGVNGDIGESGIIGGRDVNRVNQPGAAGIFGQPGAQTDAIPTPTGGGAGGAGGTPGGNGLDGGDGEIGVDGPDGANGQAGANGGGGLNNNATYILAAGSGGGSGGCGGGGSGGAGGSEGGAGGGGGGGGPVGTGLDLISGGGGGGGGGAGNGGHGGSGGSGGAGGSGGPGAGAIEIYACGRVDVELDASSEAIGGDGSAGEPGSAGDVGIEGADGGMGGSGATTATSGGNGGDGARGGRGGIGGAGGAGGGGGGGAGGGGGGGAGGTIGFIGSRLGIKGKIETTGGMPNGGDGRLIIGHNSSSYPIALLAQILHVGTHVLADLNAPRASNVYTNVVSPLLAPSHASMAGLTSGPAPYGYLPLVANDDPAIADAIANAPAGAVVAFVRMDRGPAPFDTDWQLRIGETDITRFDVLVVVNVSSDTVTSLRVNTRELRQFSTLARDEFGGSNQPTVTDMLAPGRAYAIFFPENLHAFTADVQSVVPGVVNQPFNVLTGQTEYLLRPCAFTIADHPQPAQACQGTTVEFGVAASGNGPFTYQWRHNEADLDVQANPTAASATLVLNNVGPSEAGSYECSVSNGCGALTSVSAPLALYAIDDPACLQCPACAADYDQNGGVDAGDLAAFFSDFEQGLPCADVDQNGGVDAGDVALFFFRFESGGC